MGEGRCRRQVAEAPRIIKRRLANRFFSLSHRAQGTTVMRCRRELPLDGYADHVENLGQELRASRIIRGNIHSTGNIPSPSVIRATERFVICFRCSHATRHRPFCQTRTLRFTVLGEYDIWHSSRRRLYSPNL